ncbi:MAG: sulfate adenylyltransferase [Candidatus Omnitrophica bacterium]|nr:sulfate adenylyltransferase [Candidatus Omnitrophota bacterium]
MTETIKPHGGKLVNRELTGAQAEEARGKAKSLKRINLASYEISDLEMIATGALSPLEGFMGLADFKSVLEKMHLAKGLAWSLPVVKSITEEEKKSIKVGDEIALCDPASGHALALMKIEEIFPHDKAAHATQAYRTEEKAHPGVARIYGMGDTLIAGKISLFERPKCAKFLEYRRDPAETRKIFSEKNWRRVVAFQTRNPIHRAHEYLLKCALEMADGLMVHPLIGDTKGDDIPSEIRMKCYQVLLDKYFSKNNTLLSVFPAAMRYAGPREAIFHALVRKNYGCTHFIVGRDHAGVAKPDGKPYYGSFDAHHIFNEFSAEEIGITPLFFDFTFYCKTCEEMASTKTCPHDPSHHLSLSGSKVREMLRKGEMPPPEFSRPEVAQVLIEAMREKATA